VDLPVLAHRKHPVDYTGVAVDMGIQRAAEALQRKLTRLRSKAMTNPCGKIRIPINETADNYAEDVRAALDQDDDLA
jgi:4-hydroxyphenylpyruvate dioxygenase-like putative hemolysin